MVVPINKNPHSQKRAFNQKFIPSNCFREISKNYSYRQSFRRHKSVSLRSFREKFQIYTDEQLHWLQVILRLTGTVISGILPWVLLCGGYGFLISLLNHFDHLSVFNDNKVIPNVVLILNLLLSLLLVFRTNTAHERFWEGRKLWGAMVNTVRNLARGIWIVVEEHKPKDRADKEAALRLVVAFSVAMKLHLRRDPVNSELETLMSPLQYHKLQDINHPPLEIAFWIGDRAISF